MDNEVNYSFDVKFEGDILVVGRTGCSKTTFVQNFGKNKMFGEIRGGLVVKNTTFKGQGK